MVMHQSDYTHLAEEEERRELEEEEMQAHLDCLHHDNEDALSRYGEEAWARWRNKNELKNRIKTHFNHLRSFYRSLFSDNNA